MPMYSYACTACGASSNIFKSLAKLDRVEECGDCSQPMQRVLAPVPALIHKGTPRFHKEPGK